MRHRKRLIYFVGPWYKPKLIIFNRHVDHFWFGLLYALTDWPDRRKWLKNLLTPYK